MTRAALISIFCLGCVPPIEAEKSQQAQRYVPTVHQVMVNHVGGGFLPPVLSIRDRDVVEFIVDEYDAVIPATIPPNQCPQPRRADDPNDFSGPSVFGPGGVWLRAPKENGLSVSPFPSARPNPCNDGSAALAANATSFICATGPVGSVLESSIADPGVTGVLLTLMWNQVQPAQNRFDWSVLDREVDKAVRHGKLYKIAIMAGKHGTPDWIFDSEHRSSPRAPYVMRPGGGGGVPRLYLRDDGSKNENDDHCGPKVDDCGSQMDLGSPTHPVYQQLYNNMLSSLASHLQARADRYRALAYVQVSGANLLTAENRLPKRCIEGCEVCNTAAFARAGYTADGLSLFYQGQMDHLQNVFPDKLMSYALIQAGFPRVRDASSLIYWDNATSSCIELGDVPEGTEQTTTILDDSMARYGIAFGVQHNGLGPTGGLNAWVKDRGAPDRVTGYQMNNEKGVATPADVEAAFFNLQRRDGQASWVEIYEERLWDIQNNGGMPTTTLYGWNRSLHDIREAKTALGPGRPTRFRRTFYNPGFQPVHHYYMNPVGSSRVDLQACKLEYSIVSPK